MVTEYLHKVLWVDVGVAMSDETHNEPLFNQDSCCSSRNVVDSLDNPCFDAPPARHALLKLIQSTMFEQASMLLVPEPRKGSKFLDFQ